MTIPPSSSHPFIHIHPINKHPILENKIPKERIKPKIFVLRHSKSKDDKLLIQEEKMS